jgi:hypothetical protein
MSLRVLGFALMCGIFACGSPPAEKHQPRTAKEKQMREARDTGEIDPPGKKWGKWRYQGERADCFFVVSGGRCFKTENAACQAVHCKTPKKCTTVGAGPAQMTCK